MSKAMEPEDPNLRSPWGAYPALAARATAIRRDTADTAVLNPVIAEHRRQLRDALIVAGSGRGAHITSILADAEAMADLVYPRKV